MYLDRIVSMLSIDAGKKLKDPCLYTSHAY